MQVQIWQIDRPIPYARNARKIPDAAVDKVAASITEFGWRQPIVVDPGGVIVAGHARLLAARKLGLSEVPVHVALELTPAQIKAYRLMDNRSHQETSWDLELLAPEIEELQALGVDLSLTGFDDLEISGYLASLAATTVGLTDEDACPQPLDEAVSRRGDLWLLGAHRLLCGDSADREDVERLANGEVIDVVNTDPPYNVRVEPRSNNAIAAGVSSFVNLQHHQSLDVARHPSKAKATTNKMRPKDRALENDFMKEADYDALLRRWFGNLAAVLKPGGSFYVWGGYANCANYPPALAECGLYFSQAIIWVKEHPVLTRKDFMGNHEWGFYGWHEGAGHWFNPEITNATDVWVVKKVNPTAMVHLTEKPVELAVRALTYSSRPGERVLDLFGGSGSTLIAAEKLGRRTRLMEIDPPYCDVIVRRWQEFTGKKAMLEGANRCFDEVAAERLAGSQRATPPEANPAASKGVRRDDRATR